MKNILTSIVIFILSFAPSLNAAVSYASDPVSMVAYEQGSYDDKGTIALRNNTSEYVHNVSFMLEYLNMEGTPMHYETFTRDIDIEPGMTKKLDIPAYESRRNYHYYKTEGIARYPAFKIRYQLRGYNMSTAESANSEHEIYSGYDSSSEKADTASTKGNKTNASGGGLMSLIMIICMIALAGVYFRMFGLVGDMAKKRNRDQGIWILISIISTPLTACLILWLIGKNYRY